MPPVDGSSFEGKKRKILQRLESRISIDTRSLALFRMLAGTLVIVDVLLRARNFSFFYTDSGVVPLELATDVTPEYAISVYYLTSDPTIIAILFGVHLLVGIQLLVGYKTRIATILAFLFVISIHHRNPFILSFADTLFRLLLFWGIFLPLGDRWSVDAVHRDQPVRRSFAGIASGLALGQMVFMYELNGLHKTRSALWQSGEAAVLVMGLDEMSFLLGPILREFSLLLRVAGVTWFVLLLLSPVLLLLRGRARYLLAGAFAMVHLSFAVTLRIGAFPFVAVAGLLFFLQPTFWADLDRLRDWIGIDRQWYERLRTKLIATVVALPTFRASTAELDRYRVVGYRITMWLIVFGLLLSVLVLLPHAGLIMGDTDEAEKVANEQLQTTPGTSQLYVLADSVSVTQPGWTLFAPNPQTTDHYYVFPARTSSGETVDAYFDRPLSYERPAKPLHRQFDTYRERFYMNTLRRGEDIGDGRERLAAHICDRWPDSHDEELTHVNFYAVSEQVTLDTLDRPAERERWTQLLGRYGCGENEPKEIDPPSS
jgi:hypothetical protein